MASAKTIGQRATVIAASVATLMATTIGTNLIFVKGTTSDVRIESTGVVVQSGGLLPLSGTFSLTEVNGSASGSLSITNPYNETLLCSDFVVDITTNSSPASNLDIYLATGSIAQNGSKGNASGSTVVLNNFVTRTGVTTATGSGIQDGASNQKWFKLFGNTSTTNVNRINIVSLAQTGSGLVGRYHADCRFMQ